MSGLYLPRYSRQLGQNVGKIVSSGLFSRSGTIDKDLAIGKRSR